jgi:DNA-directed RNA polymerase specialized sigma24 family protein
VLNPTLEYTTGSAVSDEALMEAITNHRPEALTEFYSRHGGRLKSVIGNVVHEEGDADDVLQDILLQIWHEADHYSPKAGKLLGWVVTLARRRAIDRLRRKQAYCRANILTNSPRRVPRNRIRPPTKSLAPTCNIFCIGASTLCRSINVKRSNSRFLLE